MSVSILEHFGQVTPSSGTANISLSFSHGVIKQVIMTSATTTTTFDVNIVNAKSREIYNSKNITGKLVEDRSLPVRGNATLTIENASADEVFDYYVSTIESYA